MIRTLLSAAVLGLGLTGAAQSATIVFSDDFNNDIRNTPQANLIKWNVTAGSVDVIGPGLFDFYPGNGNYLDMNGSTQREGRISTKGDLGLIDGKTYELTFDYGTNDFPGSFPVNLSFGLGTLLDSIRIEVQPKMLMQAVFRFVYDGSGNFLYFADASGTRKDNGGPVLDNVTLAAVPVPAAGLLLLGALGGLAALRRRRVVQV